MADGRRVSRSGMSAAPEPLVSGPPGYPLVGHLPHFLSDKLGFLTRCAEYGDVVRLRIVKPTYLLRHPEDIRHVLVVNQDNYEKSWRLIGRRSRRLYGEALLSMTGPAHRRQRHLLQPAFHRTAMDRFVELMTSATDQMLASWTCGSDIDVAAAMLSLTQQIIVRILFGPDFVDHGGRLSSAITTMRQFAQRSFAGLFPVPEYLPTRIRREFRQAVRHMDQVIRSRILDERQASSGSWLSMLAPTTDDQGARISDRALRDEALELLRAGHETIGAALAWTFYLLARHPDVESRLEEELDRQLGGRAPRGADLPGLPYGECVLSESMRLYPPTWMFVRLARHEDRLPSGVSIPKGAKLFLCQYVVHRHPKYFAEPEQFHPERFLGAPTWPRFAYFPFGGGFRSCIGEPLAKTESLVVLARIAQSRRLRLVSNQEMVPEPGLTLLPRTSLTMRVLAR